ncbi:hypothetical protein CXB51_000120 [Gossypium anomalum]|uniref:Strictosidine synthase conserved region domain-containing protein n=1 Tax=Gossypium anomalum TaxID=47600 RepID=A0A8J5ZQU1_9ROSI|nr:hypothetical protein CXB51_000120 [Gossypium anomalum]
MGFVVDGKTGIVEIPSILSFIRLEAKKLRQQGWEKLSMHQSSFIQPKILICNEKHLEAAIIEPKRALIEEGREAIKASIERNGGIPYETKRRNHLLKDVQLTRKWYLLHPYSSYYHDSSQFQHYQEGRILKQLDGNGKGVFSSVSEINEVNRTLYIGSVTKPYVSLANDLGRPLFPSSDASSRASLSLFSCNSRSIDGFFFESSLKAEAPFLLLVFFFFYAIKAAQWDIVMKKYQLSFVMLYLALCVKQSHQRILYQKHDVKKIDEQFLHQKQNVVISNDYELINLVKVTGPESIAFDCKGEGPYVRVSNSRILKWHGPKLGWKEFAIPSSIRISFKFINGLDIDSSRGVIYFTDSSTTFQRRYADFLSRSTDNSGRLLKYDLHTKNTSVIYTGLMFPNGVALNKNHSFLLVAETTRRRILKFKLGTNNFESEVFAELPRVPDNIKMNNRGEFWVALNAGRLGKIDDDVPDPIGIKYDQEERILKQLDGNGEDVFSSISEINEVNRTLYIGSVTKPYVTILKFEVTKS